MCLAAGSLSAPPDPLTAMGRGVLLQTGRGKGRGKEREREGEIMEMELRVRGGVAYSLFNF